MAVTRVWMAYVTPHWPLLDLKSSIFACRQIEHRHCITYFFLDIWCCTMLAYVRYTCFNFFNCRLDYWKQFIDFALWKFIGWPSIKCVQCSISILYINIVTRSVILSVRYNFFLNLTESFNVFRTSVIN